MRTGDWPEELRLPRLVEFDPHPPLSENGRRAVRCFVQSVNERLLKYRRGQGANSRADDVELLNDGDFEYLCEAVVNLSYNSGEFWTPVKRGHVAFGSTAPFAEVRHLEPIQLIRLLVLCQQVRDRSGISSLAEDTLAAYRADTGRKLSLRDLARLLGAVGLRPDLVAGEYLGTWRPRLRWGPEATWPYFAERLETLARALKGGRQRPWSRIVGSLQTDDTVNDSERVYYSEPYCVTNALDALDCFPRVPPPLKETLWELATGSSKTFRKRAQRVLKKEPDTFARVLEELQSHRLPGRAVAAGWLGDWNDRRAIPALREALKKEKPDQARDAMMTALEALGVPLEGILDPAEIVATAARSLAKKGVPSTLSWMPFDRLPTLRWRKSHPEIPRETVIWWLVQANRLKSPEPGALLRRQLALIHPGDREMLGQAVLSAWIDFDTMPATLEEIRAVARRRLDQYEQAAEFYGEEFEVPSLDQLTKQFMNEPGGSAIKFKGLLAIPAACGSEETARTAAEYIHRWYGLRAAQSKALVRMISWIEDPTAIQFLTATAKNFRTKGIREEAYKCLEALAKRRDWTVDQLADRMIPDAGLDPDGRMTLNFGSRRFVAGLDPGFRLQVRDEDGKLRKELPKPGKKDDENLGEEVRKAFSRSKKQVRAVVKEQTDRLFSAMCSGREWQLGNWESDLVTHPIVGRLCRRLAWRAETKESVLTVRPRGAGELIDAMSRGVELSSAFRLSIAHDVNTPPESGVAWLVHFEDYAIEPLFPQFNRGLPDPNDLILDTSSIEDFDGHVISGLTLRSVARKLGYRQGDVIDGPSFYDYRKSFPMLRLEVRVEFSGQDVMELDEKVALERMSFWQLPDLTNEGRSLRKLTLAEVPRILLLESFRDLREIAEAGEGYHPEWNHKAHS